MDRKKKLTFIDINVQPLKGRCIDFPGLFCSYFQYLFFFAVSKARRLRHM